MFLFERDLAGLGERYGFALGVVKYMQFGTLEKTVKALRALNKMMREMQNQLPEEMQRLGGDKDDDTDDEELIPDGVIPKNVSSRGAVRKKETGEEENYNTPNIKRHRPSLTCKPFTTDAAMQKTIQNIRPLPGHVLDGMPSCRKQDAKKKL